MKKTILLLALVFAIGAANAQKATAEPLLVKEVEFDFGTIPQGKPVYHIFKITNTGSTPLKLDNVQATCGCTTPEWNKEAIAPGATEQIKVGYNAAAEGVFEKPITITYNGTVWKAPAGSAPANASVSFLKQQLQ